MAKRIPQSWPKYALSSSSFLLLSPYPQVAIEIHLTLSLVHAGTFSFPPVKDISIIPLNSISSARCSKGKRILWNIKVRCKLFAVLLTREGYSSSISWSWRIFLFSNLSCLKVICYIIWSCDCYFPDGSTRILDDGMNNHYGGNSNVLQVHQQQNVALVPMVSRGNNRLLSSV